MGRMANFSLFLKQFDGEEQSWNSLLVRCLCIHIYWVVPTPIFFIFTPIPGEIIYFDYFVQRG